MNEKGEFKPEEASGVEEEKQEPTVEEVLETCTRFFQEHRTDILAELSDEDYDDFMGGLPEQLPDADLLHLYSNLYTQLEIYGLNADEILTMIGVFESEGK